MELHRKVLFVGARGTWQGMPFEILGNGWVKYTVNKVGLWQDQSDVGSTFSTREYYCLANNGQTWYFAVSSDEVYYCRQLSTEEIESLKKTIRFNPNKSLADNLENNFWVLLEEVGTGLLTKAEGRALPDLRRYNNFVYYDFRVLNKSYSVDIFNDSEAEWFEVVWIPQDKLTEIFADSLRLLNTKSAYHLQLANLWRLVSFVSTLVLVSMIFVLVELSQNVGVYDQTQNLPLALGSEVAFRDIIVDTTNQTYKFVLSATLPSDYGVALATTFVDSTKQIVSTGNVELANASNLRRTNSSSSFYASKQEAYSLIVRLDDFGKVGVPAEQDTSLSTTTETIPIRLEVYKVRITGDQGWYTTGLGIVLLIMFARYRRRRNEEKAWEYYSPRKLKVKS